MFRHYLLLSSENDTTRFLVLFLSIVAIRIPASFADCIAPPDDDNGFLQNDKDEIVKAGSSISQGSTIRLVCSQQGNLIVNDYATCLLSGKFDRVLTKCSDLSPPANLNSGISARIFNGTAAHRSEMPWTARLTVNLFGCKVASLLCGSTIIARNWILTAAHCGRVEVKNQFCQIRNILIQAGRVNFSDPTQQSDEQNMTVGPENLFIHPNYVSVTTGYDLALIKLDQNLVFTETVSKIELPEKCDSDTLRGRQTITNIDGCTANKVRVAGWGITETKQTSQALLYTNLTIVNRQNCISSYGDTFYVNTSMLCAAGAPEQATGDQVADSCSGDSGGGLICYKDPNRPYVIGVVSFGQDKCGEKGIPGVYARVCAGLPWIQKTIAGVPFNNAAGRQQGFDSTTTTAKAARKPSTPQIVPLALLVQPDFVQRLFRDATQGDTPDVRLMFEQGLVENVNFKDPTTGRTALIIAASLGRPAMSKLLLEHNAAVNEVDYDGQTALMAAASFGCADVIRVLLANNADPTLRNYDGQTAADIAKQKGFSQVLDALKLPRGQSSSEQLFTPCGQRLLFTVTRGNADNLRWLFNQGLVSNVDYKDPSTGKTALITAAGLDRPVIAKVLLEEYNASPDEIDKTGQTALMAAANNGSLSSVQTLLANYADATLQNSDGETAAAIATRKGFTQVVAALNYRKK